MHYRYCPLCRGQLDRKSSDLLICEQCSYHFYQNSKPTANAIILRREKRQVLLTKRAQPPFQGYWDFPGGFLNNGEEPLRGLRREIREELDWEIPEARLFDIHVERYPRPDIPEEAQYTLTLFYLLELDEQSGRPSLQARDDISEARWFALERLPKRLGFQGNREILKKLNKGLASTGAR